MVLQCSSVCGNNINRDIFCIISIVLEIEGDVSWILTYSPISTYSMMVNKINVTIVLLPLGPFEKMKIEN